MYTMIIIIETIQIVIFKRPHLNLKALKNDSSDDEESSDVTIKQPNAPPVTPSIFCVTPSLSCVIYDEWQLENGNHEQLSVRRGTKYFFEFKKQLQKPENILLTYFKKLLSIYLVSC